MNNAFDKQMKRLTALREIIQINYPNLFDELIAKEEMWVWNGSIDIAKYQIWVESNIPLQIDDYASIAVYSLAYGKSIAEVVQFLSSQQK